MDSKLSITFLATLLLLQITFVLSGEKHPLEKGVHVIKKGDKPVAPQPPDTLLYSDNPKESGQLMRKIGKEYCYPPQHSTERVTITRYEVSDQNTGKGGGLAFEESGGVGQNQVCFYLKTKSGGSYRYNIQVYGYRITSDQHSLGSGGNAHAQNPSGNVQPQGSMNPPHTGANIQPQPQYPAGYNHPPQQLIGNNQLQNSGGYMQPQPGSYAHPPPVQSPPGGYAHPPPLQPPPVQPPPVQPPPVGYAHPPPMQSPPGGYPHPPPVQPPQVNPPPVQPPPVAPNQPQHGGITVSVSIPPTHNNNGVGK